MRLVAAICATLAIGLADPAAAQIYSYEATLSVPDLLPPAPQTFPNQPQGLAFDTASGRLLIVEGSNQVVQIVDGTSFGLLGTIGVAGVAGSDGGHLSTPGGVAMDQTGNRILIADTGNDRVQLFDAKSLALVGTLGVAGVPGADNGHLSAPAGVAIDAANSRILVADTANDRVQLFDAKSLGLIGTIGVAGSPGTDNGHFSAPQAVAIDAATGHLLVADTGNNRIQVFDAQSGAYIETVGQIGGVTNLGIDVTGRRVFAANPPAYDVVVIDADALTPVSTLGLIGSFGIDNARFLTPGGLAVDPATGRIFAGDAALNRIQIFGQPSWLIAAVAPAGRAVTVGQTAAVFATVINTAATDFSNCQITLPSDAPQDLALGFQTTAPATNLPIGQLNQPVTIQAGQAQSFVLTLTAAAPVTALGESFLFTCDGTTPAAIFSGINTADMTFSAAATADIVAAAATPAGSSIISVPLDQTAYTAFPIAAFNLGATSQLQVTADSGSFYPVTGDGPVPGFYQTLPLKVLLCQTNPFSGQCLAPPAATLSANFPNGATATFNVFLAATGVAIPSSLQEPRLFLRFDQPTGAALPDSVGIASVAVATVNNQ